MSATAADQTTTMRAHSRASTRERFLWCLRREVWENRSLYVAPLIAAGVILFAFLISTFAGIWEAPLRLDPTLPPDKLAFPYTFSALLLMGVTFVVSIFYCIDALHGDRRDRSILFWKSLPVSDQITVLSKASIPILILPLLTFAISIATQWVMLLISTGILLVSGQSVAPLWSNLPFFRMSVMLLYHLVAVHGLWYAPMYAWILLVSAWARRAVFLWAALPFFVIFVIERIAFRTMHFASFVEYRMSGGGHDAPFSAESLTMPLSHFNPGQFLLSPGLWIGFVLAAIFLAGAVRLRRHLGPI